MTDKKQKPTHNDANKTLPTGPEQEAVQGETARSHEGKPKHK